MDQKKTRGRKPLGLVRLTHRCTKLQSSFIKAYSEEYGIPESETVRKALDLFIDTENKKASKFIKSQINTNDSL